MNHNPRSTLTRRDHNKPLRMGVPPAAGTAPTDALSRSPSVWDVFSSSSDASQISNTDADAVDIQPHWTSPTSSPLVRKDHTNSMVHSKKGVWKNIVFRFQNQRWSPPSNTKVHSESSSSSPIQHDGYNYALLIALYTLQGIPLGLSASIPFLIQQKMVSSSSTTSTTNVYQAQALFSFCSWPFSMKLLWAPLVDSIYVKKWGRRKSWLIPIQCLAGLWMIGGSSFMEHQLGPLSTTFNIQGMTLYFLVLYLFMATQDIAVDGWAITMLSPQNRGKGPVCNSIGQNIGYLIAYVGFIALNDVDMSERIWRPLLGLASQPSQGLVTMGGFLQCMGWIMLTMTFLVAILKKEGDSGMMNKVAIDTQIPTPTQTSKKLFHLVKKKVKIPEGNMDIGQDVASTTPLGVRETYQQLWAISKLPAVRGLFLILLTYRFPTSLSDNVKLLKAMELGLSKQTIAWLTPLILLPLAIVVPILANKKFSFLPHPPTALQQFLFAYKIRVTVVPMVDMFMLWIVRQHFQEGKPNPILLGTSILVSTALQAFVHNVQSNAQMSFFAQRVDPAIGGTYMTLLNTAANLGGTWPASLIMYLLGKVTSWFTFGSSEGGGSIYRIDAYFPMQIILCALGIFWIWHFGDFVKHIEHAAPEAWRTPVELEDEWMKGKEEEGKPMLVDSTKSR